MALLTPELKLWPVGEPRESRLQTAHHHAHFQMRGLLETLSPWLSHMAVAEKEIIIILPPQPSPTLDHILLFPGNPTALLARRHHTCRPVTLTPSQQPPVSGECLSCSK